MRRLISELASLLREYALPAEYQPEPGEKAPSSLTRQDALKIKNQLALMNWGGMNVNGPGEKGQITVAGPDLDDLQSAVGVIEKLGYVVTPAKWDKRMGGVLSVEPIEVK